MSEETPSELKFNYLKSPSYRTAHIDGVFGGPTPQGKIAVTLFSERLPIPTETVHSFDGKAIGEEIKEKRQSRQAIIREIEVTCVLDAGTAITVADWLKQKVEELKKYEGAANDDNTG